MSSDASRIAVTGIGVVSALGRDAPQTFERLLRGERALAPVTLFDTTAARSRVAAEIAPELLEPEALRGEPLTLSRSDRLALQAAREALRHAGHGTTGGATGLSIGGTTGGMALAEAELFAPGAAAAGLGRARRLLSHPLSATATALDALLGPFTHHSTVCTACSSGATAIVQGAHWLRRREVERVLAGGVDALCRMTFAGFDALGALDPEPCRPFDRERRGLNLGEGACFLVLELEETARARGATVLAWLSGWALGAEAHHATHPEPSGRRAAQLIRDALAVARLGPAELDYVNAHGTGTLANDAMETKALLEVLGDEALRVPVSSSKGQVGHTLGAAGALEAAISVLALGRGMVPPTVGLKEPESPGLRHVFGSAEPAELRSALSSSFGFGGMNAVLVFEHASAPARGTPVRSWRPFVVSAAVPLGLELGPARPPGPVELVRAATHDPRSSLEPERSRRFDRGAAGTTLAVGRALELAGIGAVSTALAVGNAYGCVERSLSFLDRLRERGPRFTPPAEFPQLVHSSLAGNASIYLGLEGPVAGVADGPLGGPAALARALAWLELGLAPAAVAGAIEAHDAVVAELSGVPSGRERGEGGGFLVIEPAARAGERGHAPLARLVRHTEERGLQAAEWVGPRSVSKAVVVLAPAADDLAEVLVASSWRHVPRVDLGSTGVSHEALSATALALGALLVARGAAEVLVLAGSRSARYVTHLEAMERRP